MIRVRVFKGLDDKRKSYYAVTGTGSGHEARTKVSKYTKTRLTYPWNWCYGIIAPYKKGVDGIWWDKDDVKGQPCIIVYK